MRTLAAIVLAASYVSTAAQTDDSQSVFANAIGGYLEIRKEAASSLSMPSSDVMTMAVRLAEAIRSRRPSARPGDLFGPAARSIRETIARELAGPQGRAILSAINESNTYGVKVRVNHRYPPGLPRATMPGQLVTRLPDLPEELEYRFFGRSLLLVDDGSQLVVDLLPDVLPPSTGTSRFQ